MAFIIRHISTDRFWVSGADQKIRLGSGATKYTVIDGVLKNAESGLNVMHAALVVQESSTHPTNWLISDGLISTDGLYAFWDADREMIRAGDSPEKWVVIYDGAAPVAAVEEPVAAVEEPDDESVPDLVSDEDVPVARSAALIEEALNASLVVEDEVEDAE